MTRFITVYEKPNGVLLKISIVSPIVFCSLIERDRVRVALKRDIFSRL